MHASDARITRQHAGGGACNVVDRSRGTREVRSWRQLRRHLGVLVARALVGRTRTWHRVLPRQRHAAKRVASSSAAEIPRQLTSSVPPFSLQWGPHTPKNQGEGGGATAKLALAVRCEARRRGAGESNRSWLFSNENGSKICEQENGDAWV
jgi:hypothetical protein